MINTFMSIVKHIRFQMIVITQKTKQPFLRKIDRHCSLFTLSNASISNTTVVSSFIGIFNIRLESNSYNYLKHAYVSRFHAKYFYLMKTTIATKSRSRGFPIDWLEEKIPRLCNSKFLNNNISIRH